MDEMTVLTIGREALRVALLSAAPLLLAGAVVGLVVSVLQVATSIQDVTITFIPKIVGCGLVLLITLPWIVRTLTGFTREIFQMIATITP
jgi:flagellar biosynthesis protein FliQ